MYNKNNNIIKIICFLFFNMDYYIYYIPRNILKDRILTYIYINIYIYIFNIIID